MVRKIVGIVLLLIDGFVVLVLLMSGGPIVPHILGPIVLAGVGVVLLSLKKKAQVVQPD